jgi:hypothetical protein
LTSSITRAKARASTPVSPPASTGMMAVPFWATLSTASVSRTIGRVSDLATRNASAAAHSTAIKPTTIELFRIVVAGPMMVAFGATSMTAIHSLPASSAGASATPFGRPVWSVATCETLGVAPRAAARSGKSLGQLVVLPNCEPNSRPRSG